MIILLQGAMDEEVDIFLDRYGPARTETVAGFDFSVCGRGDDTVIISKTGIGVINASMCTAVGIQKYSPDLVINQGCAGAHTDDLDIGDIVVGESAVYINDFKTPTADAGRGSDSLRWTPGKRCIRVRSAPRYVELADAAYYDGNKYTGILGSGDLFSREVDRIRFLHDTFGELSEDMESVAALAVCERFGTDGLALRIISNNELKGSKFDYGVCAVLQNFVVSLVDTIFADLK